MGTIAIERRAWAARIDAAAEQLKQLQQRLAESQAEQQTLAQVPVEIAGRREILDRDLGEADTERRAAASALGDAEAVLSEKQRAAKAAQNTLGESREERVRRQAARPATAGVNGT